MLGKTSNHLLVILEVINTSIWLFTDGLLNLVVETVCAHERVAWAGVSGGRGLFKVLQY